MISHLGRYEINEELGRGAMGIVYKAYDPLIERFVAVKTINLQVLSETDREEYEARFYQEAKAAGHLAHPNIVTIYDLGESGDVAYIAMELMVGLDLDEMLHGKKRLLVTDALNITIQVANGLFYAHQRGVVHGDIKPSNIMVLGDNLVKIADFGIARMIFSEEGKQDEAIFGTPSFMSPEQMLGKPIDPRSDIFSLGVVLYYMLTDRLPFPEQDTAKLKYQLVNAEPEKPSALNLSITGKLESVIIKCLAKDPDARYRNANDLVNDLRTCLSTLQNTHTGPEQSFTGSGRFKRLKSVVSPRRFSQRLVAQGSYFAMSTMLVISIVDMLMPTSIQMNLLYIFPLILISLHCERIKLIGMAVVLALFLQGLNLVIDDIPLSSKIFLALMILVADIAIVFLARIARINFIEVERISSFDSLTGLRNRMSLEVIADIEIDRQKQKRSVFSFACIELHKLKEFNQANGYTAGDKAIKHVAHAIRESIRQFDTASRIGGDEFAILMPNTNAKDCEAFCKKLSLKILKEMEEASLFVSTKIGFATFENPPVSISEVFDKAENAMHMTKTNGISFEAGT